MFDIRTVSSMFLFQVFKSLCCESAVRRAWAAGVRDGKQPDSSARETKEAAVVQPDMQQALDVSQKVRLSSVSAHCS